MGKGALVPPSQRKAWARSIDAPAQEFPKTPLPLLSGHLPAALRGVLYRNGPGRLERQGQRVNHWFDGDGAVLAVHLSGDAAWGTYRYVRSAGYVDEEDADQFLYSGYGSLAPGPLWQRWKAQLKNAANTSVLVLPNKLLALWEGGWPHHLHPETLETLGVDGLGQLAVNEPYSAHPKRHPKTGQIFNFGMVAGANATLNVYRSAPSGEIQQKADIPLNGIPLIHDFVLADRYLIFCVPPVRLNPLPALLGFQSFSDALIWQPKRGTQIVVIDAETFEVVSCEQVDPWFQWHFGKGYLTADGEGVLEVVRYPDFDTNRHLKQIAQGETQIEAEGQLWQIRLDPQTATIREQVCLVENHCEFPHVASTPSVEHAPTYFSTHRGGIDAVGELFGAIAQFDPLTGKTTLADAGCDRYPSEPIYAPHPEDPSRGWVLTVVYDSPQHQSEVWIYDSDRLGDEPICRLGLPNVIPPSFHGAWHPTT